jgi:transaldolase
MSLKALIDTGTKVWSDGVDPDVLEELVPQGITGATSNPIIITDLIKSGRFDSHLENLLEDMNDAAVTWAMTDYLVSAAQERFQEIWARTGGEDGWVSFELDPLIDDPQRNMPHARRVERYISLGRHWASGYTNRMIKVPATPAGFEAMTSLAADGVTVNVTLIFTQRQYERAREAIWRGAQKRRHLDDFKSVYSIFISRVDVYTDKHVPQLSDEAQGWMGLVNAKRMWQANEEFWRDKKLSMKQEIIFASTGAKLDWQEPDYYVKHTAGAGIQTNPPETNAFVAKNEARYDRQVDRLPPRALLDELDEKVDVEEMERVLIAEGLDKFARPQRQLLETVRQKREALAGASATGG